MLSLGFASGGHGEGASGSDGSEELQWDTPFGVGKFLGMAESNELSTNPNASMEVHWCMPTLRGKPVADVNASWKLMCSHPECHPTKHTQQGTMNARCRNNCTLYVDSCVARGSVTIAKAKLGANGKLSKQTRLELRSKGFLMVSAD